MVRGRLKSGDRVLVTGAGGGMGLAAVALAAHEGAHVVAAASSAARLAAARAAGAHMALSIDRATPVFDLRDIDIVFDPVGGAMCHPAIGTLRRGGRYLVIGFAGGMPPPFRLNRALLKEIEIAGVRAGEAGRQDPAAGRGFLAAIDARAGRAGAENRNDRSARRCGRRIRRDGGGNAHRQGRRCHRCRGGFALMPGWSSLA